MAGTIIAMLPLLIVLPRDAEPSGQGVQHAGVKVSGLFRQPSLGFVWGRRRKYEALPGLSLPLVELKDKFREIANHTQLGIL